MQIDRNEKILVVHKKELGQSNYIEKDLSHFPYDTRPILKSRYVIYYNEKSINFIKMRERSIVEINDDIIKIVMRLIKENEIDCIPIISYNLKNIYGE
jgi:hypothetical protein